MHRLAYRTALGGAAALALAISPLSAQNAPPPVRITGVSFLQYLYQLKDTTNHQNEFDVTRAYINVLGSFGEVSTRITADVFGSGTSLGYRLKYAFVAYTPKGSPLTYRFGLMTTPWIDWEEGLWDYRMQGPIAVDLNKYMTSSDIGVGVDGAWNHDQFNMQVIAMNGEGYGSAATPGDQRKDVAARFSVRLLNTDDMSSRGGLRLSAYGQYGKPTGGGERTRLLGMLSYRSKLLTLAGEGVMTRDSSTATPTPLLKGLVISGFGVLHFTGSPAALIGRVDFVKPNSDAASTTPGYSSTRIIGGVSYQLTPNLRLLGDVDWLTYKNGSPSAAAEAGRAQGLFQAQFTF
jgi:hypothetical protein